MATLLLLGLIGRKKRGLARIGAEGMLIMDAYAAGSVVIVSRGSGP